LINEQEIAAEVGSQKPTFPHWKDSRYEPGEEHAALAAAKDDGSEI